MEKVPFYFPGERKAGVAHGKGFLISCHLVPPSDHQYPQHGPQESKHSDHYTKNCMMKTFLFRKTASLLMQLNRAQSYISISHSVEIPNLAPSLVQLGDTWPKKQPSVTHCFTY